VALTWIATRGFVIRVTDIIRIMTSSTTVWTIDTAIARHWESEAHHMSIFPTAHTDDPFTRCL
jgi:hypothetical protein